MKETSYSSHSIHERWLLPIKGVDSKTRHEDTVVGNSPEVMPLDNSLNRDIQNSHGVHCIMTNHLAHNDIRQFSKGTPNLIDRGIRHIWDNEVEYPDITRILADFKRVTNAIPTVMLEEGKMLPFLVNRNGHRNEKSRQTKRGVIMTTWHVRDTRRNNSCIQLYGMWWLSV